MTAEHTRKQRKQEEKVGVYICHCGGNISDHVDVEQLARNLEGNARRGGHPHQHVHVFGSGTGTDCRKTFESGKINRVVVASCAPSLHELTFRSAIKRGRHEPLSLRTRQHPRTGQLGPPRRQRPPPRRRPSGGRCGGQGQAAFSPWSRSGSRPTCHATVIGGGVAGMRAALGPGPPGHPRRPGGKIAFSRRPDGTPGSPGPLPERRRKPSDPCPGGGGAGRRDVSRCSAGFRKSPPTKGTWATSNSPSRPSVRGPAGDEEPGNPPGEWVPFSGLLRRPRPLPRECPSRTLDTGAIVSGHGVSSRTARPRGNTDTSIPVKKWSPCPNSFKRMARKPDPPAKHPDRIDGRRKIGGMAFIHCVGSRQIPGIHEERPDGSLNEYCSRTCCSAILQCRGRYRPSGYPGHPNLRLLSGHPHLRPRSGRLSTKRASGANVLFFRYEPESPPRVESSPATAGIPLRIRVQDTLTFGEELTAEVDMVVLGVGMEASPIGGSGGDDEAAHGPGSFPPGGSPQTAPGGGGQYGNSAGRHLPGAHGRHRSLQRGPGRRGQDRRPAGPRRMWSWIRTWPK